MYVRTLTGLWIGISLLLAGACTPTQPHEATLGDQLRTGGYVIFFRHGATNNEDKNKDAAGLADCPMQRNLNALGREQAARIGEAFKAAGVPVGEIRSSEFCRCADTARIAFGRVVAEPILTSYYLTPESDRPQRVAAMKRLLATPPEPGKNTVLVGHHDMFRDSSNIILQEGEAAVLQPLGNGEFRAVAQVKPDYWEKML